MFSFCTCSFPPLSEGRLRFVPQLQMYLASEQAWKDPGVSRLGRCLNNQPDAGSELAGRGLLSLFSVRPLGCAHRADLFSLPLPHTRTLRVRAPGQPALAPLRKHRAAVGLWRPCQASSVFSACGSSRGVWGQAFLPLVTGRKGHRRAKQHSSPLDSHTVATHGAAHTHISDQTHGGLTDMAVLWEGLHRHPDLAATQTSHLTLGNHSLFIRDGSPS